MHSKFDCNLVSAVLRNCYKNNYDLGLSVREKEWEWSMQLLRKIILSHRGPRVNFLFFENISCRAQLLERARFIDSSISGSEDVYKLIIQENWYQTKFTIWCCNSYCNKITASRVNKFWIILEILVFFMLTFSFFWAISLIIFSPPGSCRFKIQLKVKLYWLSDIYQLRSISCGRPIWTFF